MHHPHCEHEHHEECGHHGFGHDEECGHHGHDECCGHHHEHEEHEMGCKAEMFFCLAKKAWKKLMVEKIKAEMDRMEGDRLSSLAKLIAETKMKKFRAKMDKKRAIEEFHKQIEELMAR